MKQSQFVDYNKADNSFLGYERRERDSICVLEQLNMESCFWQLERGLFHAGISWR